MPPRLVLLNGAPGAGKSTLAQALAGTVPMSLALDVDQLKHALGGWDRDPGGSGHRARELALALASAQLRAGDDVVIGQYLARLEFIHALEQLARSHEARFHELLLDLDAQALAERLAGRAVSRERPEHAVNTRLVGPADAPSLISSLDEVRARRPDMVTIDATGSLEETVAQVIEVLGARHR